MRKVLLILVAACTVLSVSAQKTKTKSVSFDFSMSYKSEVSIGFAITGALHKTFYAVPGYGGDTGIGSVPYPDTRARNVYNGEVTSIFSRPFVETIHGVQIGDYLFAGAGIGLQYYCGKLHDFQADGNVAAALKGKATAPSRWNAFAMPIFADIRGMYPVNEDLVPFINLGLGGTPIFGSAINYSPKYATNGVYTKVGLRGGLYCDFGGGVRWKDYGFSIGLQHQALTVVRTLNGDVVSEDTKTKIKTNAFYLKVTYNF